MSIEKKDYTLSKKILPLSNSIYVLPSNYDTETDPKKYYYPATLPNFLKLAKKENLSIKVIGQEHDYNLSELRSSNFFAPLLLISTLYATQNPDAVSVALNMLATYLVMYFSGERDPSIKFNILVREEKNTKTKMITYDGPVSGLSVVKDVIQQAVSELKEGK